jgi:sodium transport system permease protein
MLAFMLAVVSLIFFGPLLSSLGMAGSVLAQVLCFVVPALAVSLPNVGRKLGLTQPTRKAIIAAVLIGVSFWLINLVVVGVPAAALFGNEEELERLSRTLEAWPLWFQIIAAAAVPAVCEEFIVRGVLLRSLATRLGALSAIVITSLLFGLMHVPLARMFPAAATGAMLAYITLASGSLIPAMVVHFLNNSVAILVSHAAGDSPPPLLALGALVLAALATVTGLRLVRS